MLFATAIVAASLSVMRLPAAPDLAPITSLLVTLVRELPRPEVGERPRAGPRPETPAERPASDAAPAGSRDADRAAATDWETLSEAAISDYLDSHAAPPGPNPVLDAQRRAFGDRYQPLTIERPPPTWENAEPDQLGRTVLRNGDCYRVIADPNVGSQYRFETFDQHLVTCTYQKRLPEELPWVAEIRDRYHYLKYPDGIVPDDDEAQRAQ